MSEAEVITRAENAVASASERTDVLALLTKAIDNGTPVETMERLLAMHERVADRQAKSEFMDAMTSFHATCPPIPRNRTGEVVTKSGGKYSFDYADLDSIAATTRPVCQALGLSWVWDTKVDGPLMVVKCTLTHVGGHSESSSCTLPHESKSGASAAQKYTMAQTTGKRLSLTNVLGLTMVDPGSGVDTPSPKIDDGQASDIETMLDPFNKHEDPQIRSVKPNLLAWLGAASVADIEARDYHRAVKAIEGKMRDFGM